jgi:hypothetical protein
MRLHPGLGLGFALTLTLALPGACNSNNGASGDDGGATDATTESGNDASEPPICMEFTEPGSPCSAPSPVRCFPECEAGGCYCSATAQGPRWTCQSDLSCLADCAPLDDGCTPPMGGDDGPGDDSSGEAGSSDSGSGESSGGEGGDSGGDAGGDSGPGDAGDASG